VTLELVRNLIAGGETFDVEFKGERAAALNDHDYVASALDQQSKTLAPFQRTPERSKTGPKPR